MPKPRAGGHTPCSARVSARVGEVQGELLRDCEAWQRRAEALERLDGGVGGGGGVGVGEEFCGFWREEFFLCLCVCVCV